MPAKKINKSIKSKKEVKAAKPVKATAAKNVKKPAPNKSKQKTKILSKLEKELLAEMQSEKKTAKPKTKALPVKAEKQSTNKDKSKEIFNQKDCEAALVAEIDKENKLHQKKLSQKNKTELRQIMVSVGVGITMIAIIFFWIVSMRYLLFEQTSSKTNLDDGSDLKTNFEQAKEKISESLKTLTPKKQ